MAPCTAKVMIPGFCLGVDCTRILLALKQDGSIREDNDGSANAPFRGGVTRRKYDLIFRVFVNRESSIVTSLVLPGIAGVVVKAGPIHDSIIKE
jgi:hypothetical protein